MDHLWKERDERCRRETEIRDREFNETLANARQLADRFRILLSEVDHESRRDDMRDAYTSQGQDFDPYQIEIPLGPTGHYQEVVSQGQPPVPADCPPPRTEVPEGVLIEGIDAPPRIRPAAYRPPPRTEVAPAYCPPPRTEVPEGVLIEGIDAPPRIRPAAYRPPPRTEVAPAYCPPPRTEVPEGPLIEGLASPPRIRAGQRTVSDILQITPPRPASPQRSPDEPTQRTRSAPPPTRPEACEPHQTRGSPQRAQSSPPPIKGLELSEEYQQLIERVKRTVENATTQLNLKPTTSVHPLSYGFTNPPQPSQVTADPCVDPRPGPSGLSRGPSRPPSPPQRRQPVTNPCVDPQPGPSGLSRGPPRSLPDQPSRRQPPADQQVCPQPGPSGLTRGLARRTATSGQPTEASVRAAIAAGTFRGTLAEMEVMGFRGDRDVRQRMPEYQFVESYVTPFQGPPPKVVHDVPDPGARGILKRPGEEGARRGQNVMLRRKVIQITIPPRPDPGMDPPVEFTYQPGDPQYGIRHGELLPPRRLTPSPPNTCYQRGIPRTTQQLQSRRDLEADWERRQETVASREYPERKRDMSKPLPKSYTTGKPKTHPYYRGGAKASTCPEPTPSTSFGMAMGGVGRPQTPTTRTGLALRTPTTVGATRSTSAPPRGMGRGTAPVPLQRGRGRGGEGGAGGGGRSIPTRTRNVCVPKKK